MHARLPQCPPAHVAGPRNSTPWLLAAALCAGPTLCQAVEPAAATGFGAGIEAHGKVSAADLGLPIFPGARVQRDKPDESGQVALGLWGGSMGFKLHVAKYSSRAPVEQLAAFYRTALAAHGTVVDCSSGKPVALPSSDAAAADTKVATDSGTLSCDNKKPSVPGELIYKVGNAKNFRLVALQPRQGSGLVYFQLVRMQSQSL
jgi:hypothetical protein